MRSTTPLPARPRPASSRRSTTCVVKFPRWPFDKFVYADNTLGTQMKATGEVMAIGNSFEGALMKAVRGCEIKLDSMIAPRIQKQSDAEIKKGVSTHRRCSVCSISARLCAAAS